MITKNLGRSPLIQAMPKNILFLAIPYRQKKTDLSALTLSNLFPKLASTLKKVKTVKRVKVKMKGDMNLNMNVKMKMIKVIAPKA